VGYVVKSVSASDELPTEVEMFVGGRYCEGAGWKTFDVSSKTIADIITPTKLLWLALDFQGNAQDREMAEATTSELTLIFEAAAPLPAM